MRSQSANVTLHFHRLRQADTFNAVYGLTIISLTGAPVFRDGFSYEMKDARMRRAVPFIPNILDAQRRKEYVPAVASDRIRTLHEEASLPPKLDGDDRLKQNDIEVLIIAKKAGEIIRALKPVRHRLKRNSTIVLLHNGMGVLSQVQSCWEEEHERPNILEGFSTHGLSKREEFTVDHWGRGMIYMAIAPRFDESDIFLYQSIGRVTLPPVINSRHVLSDLRLETLSRGEKHRSLLFVIQQLLSNKTLNCTLRSYTPNLFLIQLRRTILQSIIQMIGTLQQCTNGEIIQNKLNHSLIGKLLKELCPALQTDPLISSSPRYLHHFSFKELYTQMRHMALGTQNHLNATLQDVIGKRETELAYHSGYLLRFAREREVEMPTWRVLHELIKAGASLQQMRSNEFIPVSKDGEVLDLPEWAYGIKERYWKIDRIEEAREVTRPEKMEEEKDILGEYRVEGGANESVIPEDHDPQQPTAVHLSPLAKRLQMTSDTNSVNRKRTLIPVPKIGFESTPRQKVPQTKKEKESNATAPVTTGKTRRVSASVDKNIVKHEKHKPLSRAAQNGQTPQAPVPDTSIHTMSSQASHSLSMDEKTIPARSESDSSDLQSSNETGGQRPGPTKVDVRPAMSLHVQSSNLSYNNDPIPTAGEQTDSATDSAIDHSEQASVKYSHPTKSNE